jgi:rubrerythrin
MPSTDEYKVKRWAIAKGLDRMARVAEVMARMTEKGPPYTYECGWCGHFWQATHPVKCENCGSPNVEKM